MSKRALHAVKAIEKREDFNGECWRKCKCTSFASRPGIENRYIMWAHLDCIGDALRPRAQILLDKLSGLSLPPDQHQIFGQEICNFMEKFESLKFKFLDELDTLRTRFDELQVEIELMDIPTLHPHDMLGIELGNCTITGSSHSGSPGFCISFSLDGGNQSATNTDENDGE